jgi:hypothetical protein
LGWKSSEVKCWVGRSMKVENSRRIMLKIVKIAVEIRRRLMKSKIEVKIWRKIIDAQ